MSSLKLSLVSVLALGAFSVACTTPVATDESAEATSPIPGDIIDLSQWKIELPADADGNGKVDTIEPPAILTASHPDYFYVDDQNRVVFVSPNKALTTPNSTNTRSELRQMLRGSDKSIGTKDPMNNFALQSHDQAGEFAQIGGYLEAELQVDFVSVEAELKDRPPAYSTVVGQIHALKMDDKTGGFGWGNEPLKIFYKKWPSHETGSVFWAYERNLPVDDPNRTDIVYVAWGNDWFDKTDPGESGIALGETFGYSVNVVGDVMHIAFQSETKGDVEFSINLANNVDANGEVDAFDHPMGYQNDPLYFKAGLYNQCSTKGGENWRLPQCPGTGELAVDVAAGHYAKARFTKLIVGPARPLEE